MVRCAYVCRVRGEVFREGMERGVWGEGGQERKREIPFLKTRECASRGGVRPDLSEVYSHASVCVSCGGGGLSVRAYVG